MQAQRGGRGALREVNMFVPFKRFQRLSKPEFIPFLFSALFFYHCFSFLFFLLPLKTWKLFLPHRGKLVRIRKIQFLTGVVLTFFLISYFFFLASFLSCEKSTAPVNNPRVALTAEYVGVTEAELLLQTRNIESNTQYQLFRDDSLISNGNLIQADITITDTLLLPAHDYTYKAQLIKDGKAAAYSQQLQITTMDTTSHKFQLERIEIPSPSGSGALNDVAIVNDNDIWAVGEIYADSAQPWLLYNAVHWVGFQWELKRIKTNACGGVDYPSIKAVFAFSHNDVLFAHTDGSITYYDGNNFKNDCSLITQLNGSANKMWGTSRNNLYVADGNGFIAHYNGSSWQKLEILTGAAGTDLPIRDIWGSVDPISGEQYILAPASLKYNWEVPLLLNINPYGYSKEFLTVYNLLHSVWFKTPQKVYLCGGGIHYRRNNTWIKVGGLPEIFTNHIRGNEENDIWVVGDFGIALHYNGMTWREYPELRLDNGNWEGLAVKEDLVVAVGWRIGAGMIAVIKPY